MRPVLCFALSMLAACATVPSTSAVDADPESRSNRIGLYVGQRSLDEDEWEPVENQATFGIEYAHEKPDSAGFEIGVMASGDEDDFAGLDIELNTREIYAGIVKSFRSEGIRPYLGGGLALIRADVEVSGIGDADDDSPAAYVHGGVAFDIPPSLFLGIDLRMLFGSDLEPAGVETDVDYAQLAFVLGFAF